MAARRKQWLFLFVMPLDMLTGGGKRSRTKLCGKIKRTGTEKTVRSPPTSHVPLRQKTGTLMISRATIPMNFVRNHRANIERLQKAHIGSVMVRHGRILLKICFIALKGRTRTST